METKFESVSGGFGSTMSVNTGRDGWEVHDRSAQTPIKQKARRVESLVVDSLLCVGGIYKLGTLLTGQYNYIYLTAYLRQYQSYIILHLSLVSPEREYKQL